MSCRLPRGASSLSEAEVWVRHARVLRFLQVGVGLQILKDPSACTGDAQFWIKSPLIDSAANKGLR